MSPSGVSLLHIAGTFMHVELTDWTAAGVAGADGACSPGGSHRPPGEPLVAGDAHGVSPGDVEYCGFMFGVDKVGLIRFVVVTEDAGESDFCGNVFVATVALPSTWSVS